MLVLDIPTKKREEKGDIKMKQQNESLNQVLEILDNYCHGGYNYLKKVNSKTNKVTKYFSKQYTKCSELGKNYQDSLCSQCPFGKKLKELGHGMSLPEELEEDRESWESMKPRWTEEEDLFLSHLINQGKLPKNIFKLYSETFDSGRGYSAVYRRIQTLKSNEWGLIPSGRVMWLKEDTKLLKEFMKTKEPIASFKRGRVPLRLVYKKYAEFKKGENKL